MKIIRTFPDYLIECRIRNLLKLRSMRQHQAYLDSMDPASWRGWRKTYGKQVKGRDHIPVSVVSLPRVAHDVRMGLPIRWSKTR